MFLYALPGYADRYPLDLIYFNSLQILKYLYEKRKDNIGFARFLGKILLLLSRDQQRHDTFYAIGWVRILHDMALDKNNIIYSLLASTILANLYRPIHDQPIYDEDDINDKNLDNKTVDDHLEKKIGASDIDTKQQESTFIPSWINNQVYGDKIILFSPTMYNIQQIDPDVRWYQEPIIDIIFFHSLAGSAFKTWRQEFVYREVEQPSESKTVSITDEPPTEEENDEVLKIGEETNWNKVKHGMPHFLPENETYFNQLFEDESSRLNNNHI
ncbi:unnamed protein product [Rotaria sordida]|uniref:Uncharacterized protein n=1 Tax=Rotaria sordida TaxID=392033 RepID=A0A815GLH5_9BILA|nr:unnamed protein product [Rotaria sordida]CAF1596483.1 unnamed protein product [Rotaria sordida]